jgi:hypothetical protein
MAREELPLGSPVDFDPSAGEPGNAAEDLGNRDAASAIFDGDAEPWTPPDSWAPINRRGHPMREPVDTFRNLRVTVPRTLGEAFAMLALSLELYETAREVEREAASEHYEHALAEPEVVERAIGLLLAADAKSSAGEAARAAALDRTGQRSAASRTAAEKLVDVVPEVVAYHAAGYRFRERKEIAAKELSVARRRHDTCKLFADRVEIVDVREAPATWRGEVIIDGARMTADEVRAMVRDTASRRGGWTGYDGNATPAADAAAAPAPDEATK